jgi:hypothetical protein
MEQAPDSDRINSGRESRGEIAGGKRRSEVMELLYTHGQETTEAGGRGAEA